MALTYPLEPYVHQTSTDHSVSQLRSAVRGQVLTSGDAGYDQARTIFLGGIDRHPAVIVRPTNADEVARVIGVARDSDLPFSIRSGGHSGAGHSTNDGGIVLDLHAMKALDIDVEGRTAWAETGLTAAEYSNGTGAHGLATGFGDTGSVGIGGITLGGGIGYLTRKYGMTIDSVIGAEVVTAQGEHLHVDASSHPDLFWAIRGGGGNFGVVTRFKYRLHPVDHAVGGLMLLPATAQTIVSAIEACERAPEELSAIVNVMPAPPMPFVPQEHHGKLVLMILACYAGDADAGARAFAPLRAVATPIVDMIRPIRYPEMYPPEDQSYHPKAIARTLFIDRVDRGVAETILDFLQRSDASLRVSQLRVLGGAMARVPADATAYAHRQQRILVNVAVFYEGDHDRALRDEWTRAFSTALNQGDNGAYVSFVGDEGEARVHAAYPTRTWERLAKVKARYDPANVFRMNQNIPPYR